MIGLIKFNKKQIKSFKKLPTNCPGAKCARYENSKKKNKGKSEK